ncbi:MAG: glycosyltransferase [Planctomycetes bacterium]|nr:glycosyltransferase [Planctomycetota bacterium]
MRVLHLSHTDIRFDARILKELAAIKQQLEVQVSAIGIVDDEGAAAGPPIADVRIDSIGLGLRRWRVLPRTLRHALTFVELLGRMVPKVLALKPDVVHCHDTLVLPIGALARVLYGCALIYDAHELESQKNGQTRVLSGATLLFERLCWPLVDLLVSVSPSILLWYQDKLGAKRSVLVMNAPTEQHGAKSHDFPDRYFHRRFGIANDRKVFVYLGILAQGRGIPLLLEAFGRQGCEADLVFIGYGDLIGVGDAARRLPNVHLHPAVPHDQVVSIVRTADYGICLIEDVSLSDRLCLPNKLFEYAFASLPVLASDLPEIRRVVNHYRLGLCCAPNANSVASTIGRLVAERWTVDVPSLQDLSWSSQASRLVEAYREIGFRRGLSLHGD